MILKPWSFVFTVLLLTWIFWIPAVFLSGDSLSHGNIQMLIYLGGLFGKALPAFAFPLLAYGRQGLTDLWNRSTSIRRLGLAGTLLSSLTLPSMSLLAVLTGYTLGFARPDFAHALSCLTSLTTLVPMLLSVLIFGPLPEELGWRGYELDRLSGVMGPIKASLALGLVWGIWHLPLFFIDGTYQSSDLAFGTLRFWLWWPDLISTSVLIAWVYYCTNRSVLAAIVMHFSQNFIGELLDLPTRYEYLRTGFTVASAIVIAIIWMSNIRKEAGGSLNNKGPAGPEVRKI